MHNAVTRPSSTAARKRLREKSKAPATSRNHAVGKGGGAMVETKIAPKCQRSMAPLTCLSRLGSDLLLNPISSHPLAEPVREIGSNHRARRAHESVIPPEPGVPAASHAVRRSRLPKVGMMELSRMAKGTRPMPPRWRTSVKERDGCRAWRTSARTGFQNERFGIAHSLMDSGRLVHQKTKFNRL